MIQREDWQLDFEWLRTRHYVKDTLAKTNLPDLQTIMLLIGIQEARKIQDNYTKEEKQDLMHVAVCHLLTEAGYFAFKGYDDDDWPHFEQVRVIPVEGEKAQEKLLKECVINYFQEQVAQHND